MQSVYTDGTRIEVIPYDLACKGSAYKLDLLYYNNVNKYGEILTSLVYNSGLRAGANVNRIQYDPTKLFKNTAIEKTYSFTTTTETSTRWKNADLLTTGTILIKDQTYKATDIYPRFDITTGNASDYKNGSYMYDGWYTFVSVAVGVITDAASVIEGTLRTDGATVEYALIDNPTSSAHWSLLNLINPTVPIYNLIRLPNGTNKIYTQEFMVTTKTQTMYKHLLDRDLDRIWFSQLNLLSPKMRTLDAAIEHDKFDVAQHIINSINNSLLAILI